MEIINGAERYPAGAVQTHLALGNFDGVHRGHLAIISALVKRAGDSGGKSAALILNPHPVIALHPDRPYALLTDIADRAEIMASAGLDYLLIEPFDVALASLTPCQFIVDYLVGKLKVNSVFIGENYQFGRGGSGTPDYLEAEGRRQGFKTETIPLFSHRGERVSSSLVRSLLSAGRVEEASHFLGYYFYRCGRVVRGYGIGKKLVYPTANVVATPGLLWPGAGVYFTGIDLDGRELYGVTNVGSRPTFSSYEGSVETYILDFEGNLYGRDLRMTFFEKIRDIKKFADHKELKAQVALDIEKAYNLVPGYSMSENKFDAALQAKPSVLRLP